MSKRAAARAANREATVPSPAPNSWRFAFACGLALILLLAAYSNHFHNAFHFDDSHTIEQNIYIRDLSNLPRFFVDARTFSSYPANAVYRPLVSATYAVDHWLAGGLKPWQFHATQFALLVLLGVGLVLMFLAIMNRAARHRWNCYLALFAALWFCIHTANTETVNYLSSRSDLLSTLAVVGAFLMYFHMPRQRRFYLYLSPMIIGALAKPPAVIFAPLLTVFLVLFHERGADGAAQIEWRRVWTSLRQTLPAFGVGLFLFWLVHFMSPPTATYGGGSRWHYLLTQFYVWLHYLRLFFLPVGLTADTDWTLIAQWHDGRVLAGMAVIAGLAWLAWRYISVPAGRPVTFGLVWFALALLPTSSLFPLAEVANEHRIFFPYIGLALAVVWGAARHAQPWLETRPGLRPVALAAALLVIVAHAAGTYQRNQVWRSEETLWADTVVKSPANGRAWMNYGLTQMAQGKFAEAKRLFEQAQIYNPNYAHLEINLGIVTDRLGDRVAAEEHFRRALVLQPEFAEGYLHYAQWLKQQARAAEAVPHLQRALALSPALSRARTVLMDLYAARGAKEDLRILVRDTLALAPADPMALAYASRETPTEESPEKAQQLYNRGLALTGAGRHLDAALAYRQALRFGSNSPDALNNLGWSLAKLGFFSEAVVNFQEAVRLRPDFSLAQNNLQWAQSQLNKENKAGR